MTTNVQATGLSTLEALRATMAERRAPRHLDPAAIPAVAETAQSIACSLLEQRGNTLSNAHREAIGLLVREFAELAAGQLRGRRAYALPTGMGKTTAAAAFITALYRLGHHHVALAVAASQVQALGKFRDELLDLGVPADLIGIKHTLPRSESEVFNSGDDDRLYQLVTHIRARDMSNPLSEGGKLASEHQGRARALCIFDETLWRADTVSQRAADARRTLAALGADCPFPLLVQFTAAAVAEIDARLPEANGLPQGVELVLPQVTEQDAQAWRDWAGRDPYLSRKGLADDLAELLSLADQPLRIISTGQGKGLISARTSISAALTNVAILDASTPIRELVKLDETISSAQLPPRLKTYEHVRVFQRLTAGGRSSLQDALRAGQLAREVASIVTAEIETDPARSFLIFTFKDRDNDKPAERIRAELRRHRIDLDARNPDGKPRFEFLTWGQQEGLNGYEHCNTVILAGVLTRDSISIAAAIRGQAADPATATPEDLIQKMIASEIGHCVYQAASRGSCRVVENGKAQAMHLHILHKDANLRGLLEPVMPDAVWEYPEPQHLPPSKRTGKTSAMLRRLLETLDSYPAERVTVSSQELKARMGLDPTNRAAKDQFTRAIGQLTGRSDGWEKAGRSVRRARRGK